MGQIVSAYRKMPWGQQKPDLGFGIDLESPFADGLVGCWLFNNSINELVSNSPCVSSPIWTPTSKGIALDITAHENRVDCARNLDLAVDSFTISQWIYIDSAVQYKVPFGIWDSTNSARALQIIISGPDTGDPNMYLQLAVYGSTTNCAAISASNAYEVGKWVNIVCRYTPPFTNYQNISLYANGKLLNTEPSVCTNGSGTRVPATGLWSIGSRYYTDLHIDGKILNTMVWDRGLARSEIQELYAEPYSMIEGWNYNRTYEFIPPLYNTWTGTTDTNYNTATNWSFGHVPTTNERVAFSGSVNCALGATNTAALEAWDMTGYSGTFSGSGNITVTNINDSSVRFSELSTVTWSGQLLLNPATGTTLSLTSAGKLGACTELTLNGAGTVVLVDGLTIAATKSLLIYQGKLKTDGASDNSGLTHNLGKFLCNGTVNTLTLGNSIINLNSFGTVFNLVATTFNSGSSTININGTDNGFGGGGGTYNTVHFGADGNHNITGTNVFANLSWTTGANQTSILTLQANQTVNGTLTLNGNSAVNRLLVLSNTIGTARTITLGASATCASVSNFVDMQDITMSGGTTNERDFQANSKSAGDCGGNSGVTFTAAQEQTWSGVTGNWSNSALWTSRIPLPQDNVVIPNPGAASRTLTADMPRLGKDITVTNAVAANKPAVALTNQTYTVYGSIVFVDSTYMTPTCNRPIYFAGRSNATLTSAGFTGWDQIYIVKPGATLQLGSSFSNSTRAGTINLYNGTFDTNNFTVTTYTGIASRVTSTRALIMGSADWVVTYTTVNWDCLGSGTGLTVTPGTGKIVFSGASGTKSFWGGSKTWPSIDFTGAGTLKFNEYDTDTIGVLTVAGGNTITLKNGKTLTVSDLVFTGANTSNRVTINSTTAGSAATMSKASGVVSIDWATIQDSTVTGGATWYAGANSTNVSNNTGWLFTDPILTTFGFYAIYPYMFRLSSGSNTNFRTTSFPASIHTNTSPTRQLGINRNVSARVSSNSFIRRIYGAIKNISARVSTNSKVNRIYNAVRRVSAKINYNEFVDAIKAGIHAFTEYCYATIHTNTSITEFTTALRNYIRNVVSSIAINANATRRITLSKLISSQITTRTTANRIYGTFRNVSAKITSNSTVTRIYGAVRNASARVTSNTIVSSIYTQVKKGIVRFNRLFGRGMGPD